MAGMIVDTVMVYAGVGGLIAAVFLVWGLDRIDSRARGAHVFRPLLIPGVVVLWPLVLGRWIELEIAPAKPPIDRHRPPLRMQTGLTVALALAIPVFLFGGLVIRQDGPMERPAVRLAPPDSTEGQTAPKESER